MRSSRPTCVIVVLLAQASSALASFHIMDVQEIYFGSATAPNAQYVMLVEDAAGQTLVGGKAVDLQDATGASAGTFGTFSANVSNGAAGDNIIIGTAEAQALFGITFDQVVPAANLPFPSGRVTWAGTVYAVAYGNYTGGNGAFGSPAPTPALGFTLVEATDSNHNSLDFVLGRPHPRNNARVAVPDTDGDDLVDPIDNCPTKPNASQQDGDNDARGDACDNCPAETNEDQSDLDGDGAGDACDACVVFPNPDPDDPGADPCDIAWGDLAPFASLDGAITAADAVQAIRYALGADVPTSRQFHSADVAPATTAAGQPPIISPTPYEDATPQVDAADLDSIAAVIVGAAVFASPR
jgi:hypothetical protein